MNEMHVEIMWNEQFSQIQSKNMNINTADLTFT